ncbi:Zinc finger, RING-type [Sesbania bispinosa]|nr:Zinc finger, RING-type [Sesbania bispinosa]
MGNSLQSLHRHREEDEGVNAIEEQLIREGTCEICIELFTPETLFQNNNLCVHPFCVECIATYIETKIGENVGKIPCPALDCENQLDPVFCSSIISKQLFDKWCDALCNSAVLEIQNRTYCPNQLCSALVINECDDKSVKEVMCPNCKQYFCFKCQIPWHTGYRCHEVGQFRDRNDVLFGQLAERRRWSRCYRCGECLERAGGCRVIHCRLVN